MLNQVDKFRLVNLNKPKFIQIACPYFLSCSVNVILLCLCYSMMNAFSEGLTLAERSGLNPSTLLDVLVSYCDKEDSC